MRFCILPVAIISSISQANAYTGGATVGRHVDALRPGLSGDDLRLTRLRADANDRLGRGHLATGRRGKHRSASALSTWRLVRYEFRDSEAPRPSRTLPDICKSPPKEVPHQVPLPARPGVERRDRPQDHAVTEVPDLRALGAQRVDVPRGSTPRWRTVLPPAVAMATV